ncbi:hypothetical protein AVEN_187676-1 [Araneus ventricosus]|uniref:Tc1-like transposase DDE domain-containing protein n=1 Tax=Araneus ventricosus TaxID=182803 RepID=A0A4Y2SM16_ARAVE|nr:hypothetical protein AVEN_187676-1 [Araneus ventricosus]
MASKPEPPTQANMAKALNVSQQFVSYPLKHMLEKKCHEKPKCHHLNERSVQIKRQCSWPLYKLSRLYPNDDAVFHQDSAPSHASNVTQKFLTDQQVQFLRPQQWMPNSPDAAPCDYFLWGHLKNKLNKRRVSTLKSFGRLFEKM